jgi:tetratricopeptide (TPR) repeat protein
MLLLRGQLDTESMRDAALERARALLEEAHAAKSPDVRLRFDLGEVYYALDRFDRSVAVLVPALEMAPDHPAAVDALAILAYAYAKLDKSSAERATYERYLARVNDDRYRATAMLNLAEAEMRLGNMKDAIAGYKETIDLCESLPSGVSQAHTLILAVWGLAVALDRDGQAREGLVAARRAVMMDPDDRSIAHDPNVFFVPAYDRFWYLALGATVRAEDTKAADDAARAWKIVEQTWNKYIDPADANDRWLALAKVRRERAKAQRIAAEARVVPPPKPVKGAKPPPLPHP